jgi:hypothetical protein
MRYWLANHPQRPWMDVSYSAGEYEQDRQQLLALVEEAACGKAEADYPCGNDKRHCACCTYRTLCARTGMPVGADASARIDGEYFDVDSAAELDY